LPAVNKQLFTNSPALGVSGVTSLATDDLHTQGEKLARIMLDEMYHFVGRVDDSNVLDINLLAPEGVPVERYPGKFGRPAGGSFPRRCRT
jgi:hypothetical protein